MKDTNIHLRVEAEEKAKLEAIAKYHDLSITQVVTKLINREFEAINTAKVNDLINSFSSLSKDEQKHILKVIEELQKG